MQSSSVKPRLVVDARMILSSGIGRYLRAALAALARDDVDLILLGKAEEIRMASPDIACEIVEIDAPVYQIREHIALAQTVPDCDVFFSPHVTTTAFKVKAKSRIVTIHDTFHLSGVSGFGLAKKAYARAIYANALRVSDTVMTVSEFTRGELAWEFPSHTAKLKVNYNFVDRDIFHPDEEMPTSINGRYILFVGNLKPHKNLAAAIEALKLLDDDGLRLAVVGADSGFIHGLGKDLKRLRSEDRVSFLGRVHDDELRRLYSHAACLIQPSLYEGFGYPPLEAMACGCPALCSEIPALRETCGDAAIFRNPRSPEDLADGIERATREGEAKKESIIRGFERAASFSRKRFEEGIRAVVWESLC